MTFARITRIVPLALTLLLWAGAASAGETWLVTYEKARFRAGPGTNYQIIWSAGKYAPFEYLATYQDWLAIRWHDGDVAWIHESVVGKGMGAVVTNKKANIRSGPGLTHDIVFTVSQDWFFKVLSKKGEWYEVEDASGDKGWVLESLVWVSR